MKDLYIIDAAGYVYRSYFAIRGMTNSKGESTNALFGFIRSVLKLFKDFNPKYVVSVFDGPDNAAARVKIYPEYKAHRAEAPKDFFHQMEWAHQFCDLMGIPQLNIPSVEADDTMGTVALWAAQHGMHAYMCTSDKDMCQLVSDKIHILNTYKENLIIGPDQVKEIHGVAPDKIIDLLAIIGDTSDNVPGISGFGPKTAVALLDKYGSVENLLAHVNDFEGKKKETLLAEKRNALLSKELVTINTSVAIPNKVEFYERKQPDYTQLKQFYSDLNFYSLIREMEAPSLFDLAPKPEPQEKKRTHAIRVVEDEKALQQLVDVLEKAPEIAIDLKNSAQDHPFTARLVGLSLCTTKDQAWYVPLNGKLSAQAIIKTLAPLLESKPLAGHDLKAALHVLHRVGIFPAHLAFDTMIASYLLNAHQRQHSLEQVALEHTGRVLKTIDSLQGKGRKALAVADIPIHQLAELGVEDAENVFHLRHELQKKLEERNLVKVLQEIELPLVPVLTQMERNGVYLDIPFLNQMGTELNSQLKKLEEQIYQLAGEPFNINSPKQLGEVLFQKMGIKAPKKTATGLSTNADVLDSLKDEHLIAGVVLEYRGLEKLRSTYVEALPQEVNPETQRIHCSFKQSVAATGRLSCQDPNLQNIPVRTPLGRKIRAAFKPQKPGWSYIAADYSQIELRILAHMSEDPVLIKAFAQKEDIHRLTASLVLNVPLDQVTSDQRFQAKAVNFGVIYGQQAFGLAQELGIDVKEAARFIDLYFQRYSKIKQFLDSRKELARTTGKSVTMTGRERLIPEINSKNGMLRSVAERLAINTPLQGTAADLIKLAMLRVDERLKKKKTKAFMVLQIHDELLLEVPDEETEEIGALVREAMEHVWDLKVPLEVNIEVGKNWEQC